MRDLALILIGAAALSACASNGKMQLVEEGYNRGALGVAAIDRGDWAAAEQNLMKKDGVNSKDPARLINLGRVYYETGRTAQALATWRKAATSPRQFEIETGDGRVVSSRQLAQELLSRYGRVETAAVN